MPSSLGSKCISEAPDLAADINGEEEKKAKVVEEVKEEDNLLVDLSDDEKPTVSEVTVGDAEEYFNDLGLEYNIFSIIARK